jgi:hypothetical protein
VPPDWGNRRWAWSPPPIVLYTKPRGNCSSHPGRGSDPRRAARFSLSYGSRHKKGLIVIDWAIGTRGNPLADHARTWLISRGWLGELKEMETSEHLQLMWQRFWDTFFRRYDELRPSTAEDLVQWQVVAATASLAWDRNVSASHSARSCSLTQANLCRKALG